MDIIDFHTHAFPDSLADRAISTLEAEIDGIWRAHTDGRVGSLLASMDAAGIGQAVVCPIATAPKQFEGILRWCQEIRSERIIPLATVHPEAEDPAGQVERIAEAGLIGIKLHPMYQQFEIAEPRLDGMLSAMEETGLLLEFHCGYDIAYGDSEQASPDKTAATLDKHPRLRLVATHLGGWRSWESVRRHLLGRDIWMETSFTMSFMSPEQVVELIRGHGVEKVLFGSDSPWADQSAEVRNLRSLPLTEAEQAAIFQENARRLLAECGWSSVA